MPTDSPLDLPALLKAAKGGDFSGLDAVCAAMRPILIDVARHALPGGLQSILSSSDVVHDAFMKAMMRIGTFRGETEEQLLSWMVKIVQRVVASSVRRLYSAKRNVARQEPLEPAGRTRDHVDPRAEEPFTHLLRYEEAKWLAALLEHLPSADKAVLTLWARRNDVKEVAEELGVTPAAAYKRLARAQRVLYEVAVSQVDAL